MNIHSASTWISQLKTSTLKPKAIRYSLLAALCTPAVSTMAGTVTINESMIDGVFSQGILNIDIRFNPAQTIENASLANLVSASEFTTLRNLTTPLDSVVNMFFVDEVNWCGTSSVSFIGCSTNPGNVIALESDAVGSFGGELEAHELGHALGLPHENFPNLMNAILDGNTQLLSAQISTILSSPLVQTDVNNQQFISINPIAIVASVPSVETPIVPRAEPPIIPESEPPILVTKQDLVAAPVPLPGAVLFFASGLISLFWTGRRKKI